MHRKFCWGLVLLSLCALALPAQAEINADDIRLLGLIYKNQFVPASQKPDASPEVKAIAAELQKNPAGANDTLGRYRAWTKALATLYLSASDEGRELATILDMRLPAKLFEPGQKISAKVFPVFDREQPIKEHYIVSALLIDETGASAGAHADAQIDDLSAKEIPLAIPADIKPGKYMVEFSLRPSEGIDPQLIFKGRRGLSILPSVKARVDKLAASQAEIQKQKIADKGPTQKLAASTVDWYANIYQTGVKADVPGAYSGHPLFMTSIVSRSNMTAERIDFVNELSFAEKLAADLLAGKDPLKTQTGDMRLAYASPADNELIPFRILIPENYDAQKKYPLVVALHGAGGDENAYMRGYQQTFKKAVAKHGYIAVSVNGRGPYGGYTGKSGQDPMDVLDLIQSIYPIDKNRTYLTGHSMGGMGTVMVGFNHADRFAALAPIAGFSTANLMEKDKTMPLILCQGDQDALVPVEGARKFYAAAQQLGLPDVKYIEKAGVNHTEIPVYVMDDIFDFFDKHTK